MTGTDVCSICLGNNCMYWIEEFDENNAKYVTKLKFVVPEVQWNYNHYICKNCVNNLRAAYDFKQLCIDSLKKLQIKEEESKSLNFVDVDIAQNEDSATSDTEQKNNELDVLLNYRLSTFVSGESALSCQQCRQSFGNRTLLFKHLKLSHKHEKPYQCNSCQESFKKKFDLAKHEKTHKFQCNDCDKLYGSCSILRRHTLVKHTNRSYWKYSCCYCNELFPTNTHLLAHSKKQHKTNETFVCFHCNLDFNDKNVLLDHMVQQHQKEEEKVPKIHTNSSNKENYIKQEKHNLSDFNTETPTNDAIRRSENVKDDSKCKSTTGNKRKPCRTFPCEFCGKILTSSVKLVDHCVSEHDADAKSVKPFACDLCEKRFSTSTILTEHKRYHTRNRQNICSFCGKGFITKNDLNCHEYIHFNERSFKCEVCSKGFNTQKNLRTHRIVKHGDPLSWKHCCAICNKRFAILSNYKVHVRRHMGDKQFCCQLCDKKFVNKDELRQHTESHSNIREFKCNLCDKEYKKKRIYEIHMTKIHGIGNAKIPKKEKKHMCHLCPKSYFERSKLTKHLMTHSGIKPFGCTVCDKKFTDNYYLKQHLKNSHGQGIPVLSKAEGSID